MVRIIGNYCKIVVNDCEENKVFKIEQLFNAKNIVITFSKQMNEDTLLLVRQLKNVNTIKSVSLDLVHMNRYIKRDHIFKCLYEGIGQQINLEKLQIHLQNTTFIGQASQHLANCFMSNMTSLSLSLDEVRNNNLLQITKGLNNIKNLSVFYFKCKYKNELDIKPIYEVISNWKQIKNLSLITEIQNGLQEQNSSVIQQYLVECEYLQTKINYLSYFSSLQKAEKLKSISLILKESNKRELDQFVSVGLPNLQIIQNLTLELIIDCYDDLIQQYLRFIIERLQNVNYISIYFQSYQSNHRFYGDNNKPVNIDFGSTFCSLLKNHQIVNFKLINNNLIEFNSAQDIINFKYIQHLKLDLCFISSDDEITFFKSISSLKNLLSLHCENYEIEYNKYVLKASKLVVLKFPYYLSDSEE